MSIRDILCSPRARRALAAGVIALSLGGLVLFRSHAGAGPSLPFGASSATERSFSGPGIHGTWAISHSRVLSQPGERVLAELRVASVGEGVASERAPLSMALVLDTSGSMQGDKIEEAKQSVLRVLASMDDRDEVALVRYTTTAEVVQALAPLGELRSSLRSRVLGMRAGGGTHIPAGLQAGLGELRYADESRIKRLVLVSDGLDSTRRVAESLARGSAERGITVSSLGIGLDFDEAYLGAVAQAGRGNFGFVKDTSALARFLERELRETASTTVRSAVARLRLPAGLRFVQAIGAEAELGRSGRELELRLGSLFAGDERRVVVELYADARGGEVLGIDGELYWTDVGGRSAEAGLDRLALKGTADASEVAQSRNHRVYARCVSALASLRNLEASEAYARGDAARAQALIDQNVADLRTAAAAAPQAEADKLDSQIQSYEQTRGRFAAAPPESAAGRSAAKESTAADHANLGRAGY